LRPARVGWVWDVEVSSSTERNRIVHMYTSIRVGWKKSQSVPSGSGGQNPLREEEIGVTSGGGWVT